MSTAPQLEPPRLQRDVALVVIGVLTALLVAEARRRFFPGEDRATAHFHRVRDLVEHTYVQPTDGETLVREALRGMVGSLDDYSRYYTGADVERVDRETNGLYRGIGVVFRRPVEDAQVLFPLPNSPARKADINVGDRFLTIDGTAVAELEAGELSERLSGPEVENVEIEVEALDGERKRVQLQPERVVDPSVRHARIVDPELGIGYAAILSFSHQTPGELDRTVALLRERGMSSMILDLRGNPGGVLDSAVAIANRFVAEGDLVSTHSRHRTEVYAAEPDRATLLGLPLILLVDRDSASASEVLAGALQDHRVALVVGETTYGKGAVQTLTHFERDGVIVKLTTSRYHTPAGRVIHRGSADEEGGIAPDLHVEVGELERDTLERYRRGFTPGLDLRDQVDAWQEELDEALYDPPPTDRVLEVACALFAGTRPEGLTVATR